MVQESYIPSREAELLGWAQNLNDRLEATPEAFGVTADQLVPFGSTYSAFAAAYAVTSNPSTKTKPAVADKNAKKAEMVRQARLLVSVLQGWPYMTDAKRDELRIPVRDSQPTPIGPPVEMPVLRVAAVNGSVLDLEVRREDGETKRKPAGVRSVNLYTHIGDDPPAQLTAWQYRGGSTKHNPQIVIEPEVQPGTKVWVTALWVNPTEQPGPACAPVQTRIGFQGLTEAA
ncbi:hypothetical protein [Algisphaera agarilytica]|uniref:Uncharacterized protein n=1 Tax=Algisphaera agarilytica TaxID=1385975 RepID=A0A7X0H5R2_9BACT|nr:hypothetical protein [Algisphaera agarilytica]MBB6429739.1 hypothetical protein [Algisphaera agarilytica]